MCKRACVHINDGVQRIRAKIPIHVFIVLGFAKRMQFMCKNKPYYRDSTQATTERCFSSLRVTRTNAYPLVLPAVLNAAEIVFNIEYYIHMETLMSCGSLIHLRPEVRDFAYAFAATLSINKRTNAASGSKSWGSGTRVMSLWHVVSPSALKAEAKETRDNASQPPLFHFHTLH
jgi:hypothetical protein